MQDYNYKVEGYLGAPHFVRKISDDQRQNHRL